MVDTTNTVVQTIISIKTYPWALNRCVWKSGVFISSKYRFTIITDGMVVYSSHMHWLVMYSEQMVLATYMCFQGLSIHYESSYPIFVVLEHLPNVLSPEKVLSLIWEAINSLLQSDISFSVTFEDLFTHFTNLETIHIRGWKVYFLHLLKRDWRVWVKLLRCSQ